MDPTTAALAVAALGVLSGPVTAWLTFRWTRRTEKERWEREHKVDEDRFDREESKRRTLRGEEAAKEILTAVDNAQLILYAAREDPSQTTSPAQEDLRPLYHQIRQQAELLTMDEAQSRIMKIADNLYYHGQTRELNPFLQLGQIGYTCSDAAHKIIRAYLHGRPLPATPRMERLQQLHAEGGELLKERYGEDDPLGPMDEEAPDG